MHATPHTRGGRSAESRESGCGGPPGWRMGERGGGIGGGGGGVAAAVAAAAAAAAVAVAAAAAAAAT